MPSWTNTLRTAKGVASLLRHLNAPARGAAVSRLLESRDARGRRLARAAASGADRLIIVCHGNIMRSAFAVAYLHQLAPELAPSIIGAGTHATAGSPAQDSALRVATEFGVSLDAHRSMSIESVTIGHDDVVVCMDRANEANVLARYSPRPERVFLVGDGANGDMIEDPSERFIVDPYARGDDATRAAFRQILEHTQRWLSLIKK